MLLCVVDSGVTAGQVPVPWHNVTGGSAQQYGNVSLHVIFKSLVTGNVSPVGIVELGLRQHNPVIITSIACSCKLSMYYSHSFQVSCARDASISLSQLLPR